MLIVIKGAGDLASGIAYRLKISGFDVVMTEIENPTTVRRTVAFSQAIFDNETIIEGIKGIKVNSIDEINEVISQGNIPVMIDEKAEIVEMSKLIKQAIAKLPQKERTVVEYRFYRNMQAKDIATMIGLSPSRITRIIQFSLNQIREYLKSKGREDY